MKIIYFSGKYPIKGGGALPPIALSAIRPLQRKGYIKSIICNDFNDKAIDPELIRQIPDVKRITRRIMRVIEFVPFVNHHRLYGIIDYVEDCLTDWIAGRKLEQCDIFWSWNEMCLISMKKTKKNGALAVLEAHWSHILYQSALIKEEFKLQNLRGDPYIQRRINRQLEEYKYADLIICPSTFVYNSFVNKGVSKNKLLVLPNGVDLELFHPSEENCQDNKFIIAFVGAIAWQKGVHYLIEAVNQMREEDNIKLILFGGQRDKGVLARYHPKVPFKIERGEPFEVAEFLRKASVLVLPSIQESFGLVVLEAMASGIPVIISENVGAKDIVRDGVDGFIVPIRDPETIKNKLAFLQNNPKKRYDMGKNARDQAEKYYWEVREQLILKTVEDLCRKRNKWFEYG